jgi:hypothetical protein
MQHTETLSPDISSPHPQTILSTTMIPTESRPSGASLSHIQPSTIQQLLEDAHIEALSTQNPPSNSNTLSARNADNQEPLHIFTLFPLLPTELRLRVWRLATFPRVVKFVPGGGKAPSVLSACRESRTETRKLYRLCIRPSSPQFCEPYPGNPIPDYGFFINFEVDIVHVNPLYGLLYEINRNVPGTAILMEHHKALQILKFYFPLWHLPTKRILFDLPGGPHAPADWLHRPTGPLYSSPITIAWRNVFWATAQLCPLLEEIMFLRRDEVLLCEQRPVPMVSATNASNAAFSDAVKAFTEAENARRKGTLFFSGVRTEKEAIQRIIEAPKEPRSSRGRASKCWWDDNPKLTFVEIKEQ